jgi:hypothetical protein
MPSPQITMNDLLSKVSVCVPMWHPEEVQQISREIIHPGCSCEERNIFAKAREFSSTCLEGMELQPEILPFISPSHGKYAYVLSVKERKCTTTGVYDVKNRSLMFSIFPQAHHWYFQEVKHVTGELHVTSLIALRLPFISSQSREISIECRTWVSTSAQEALEKVLQDLSRLIFYEERSACTRGIKHSLFEGLRKLDLGHRLEEIIKLARDSDRKHSYNQLFQTLPIKQRELSKVTQTWSRALNTGEKVCVPPAAIRRGSAVMRKGGDCAGWWFEPIEVLVPERRGDATPFLNGLTCSVDPVLVGKIVRQIYSVSILFMSKQDVWRELADRAVIATLNQELIRFT